MRYYINVFLAFILAIMMFVLILDRLDEKEADFIQGGDISKAQTIDSLQHLVDSLNAENYPCQVELGRYRIAYEIFMRRNPAGAQQYGTIISDETE